MVIFHIPSFNVKRYIRANILNIKTKIKNINIANTLLKSGSGYKRKKEFTLNFLNMLRVNGFNKTIPFIKIKNIFIIIY